MSDEKEVPHKAAEVQSIRILFDNNVIFSHRRLAGPRIDLLEMFIKRTGSTFVLPKIILEEACKKYHEDLTRMIDEVQTTIRRLDGFVARRSGAKPAKLDVVEEVKAYHDSLVKRVASLGGEIVEYEDLPLKLIAQRALAQRRPFLSEDKGCRDAILWETILQKIIHKEQQTVLVTRDAGFSDKGQLHQDLKEDLVQIGLMEDSVVLCSDLDEFLDAFAKPLPPIYLKGVLAMFMNDCYPGFSVAAFVDTQRDAIVEASKPYGEGVARSTYWDKVAELLQEPIEIAYSDFDEREATVTDAIGLDEERLFLEVDIPCVVTLNGFLDKHDYYCLGDAFDVSVLDIDWNEYVVWVETDIDATMTLVLTFNIKAGQVENWQLSDVVPTEPNWQALADQEDNEHNGENGGD